MSLFKPREASDVARLVQAYPLCWVVSGATKNRYATPLPLLAEQDSAGQVISLFGHIPLSNPQYDALKKEPRATILCMGPNGYISPRLVSNPTWGPTWNYAASWFETEIRFVPDETGKALSELAAALEGASEDAWTPAQMGERYQQLKQRIVAFRATVLETHAKFKLGQDENDLTFEEILGGLEDRTLAEWMDQTRG